MMLSKPLISFIVAFAVATGVSAAATPMARGNGYPPAINKSQCNVASVSCCKAVLTQNDPFMTSMGGLLGIPLNVAGLIGLSCFNLLGSTQCDTTPVCCENVTQNGLVNVGCSPINVGL